MMVLIAVDDSEAAGPIVEGVGRWLRQLDVDAEMLTVLLSDASEEPRTSSGTHEALETRATANLNRLATDHLWGLRWRTHIEWAPNPAGAILNRAAAVEAGMVVMGTQARTGVAGAMFGSVALAVVSRSPVPVILVGPQALGSSS